MLGQISSRTHILVLGERSASLSVTLFRNTPAPLVDFRNLAFELWGGDHHKPPGLDPAAAGRADAGVEHLVNQLVRHWVRLESAHAATGVQNVKNIVVYHVSFSLP